MLSIQNLIKLIGLKYKKYEVVIRHKEVFSKM